VTCLKVFKDELIEFLLFIRCQWLDLTVHRFSMQDEFDCVVPRLAIQQGIEGRLCEPHPQSNEGESEQSHKMSLAQYS